MFIEATVVYLSIDFHDHCHVNVLLTCVLIDLHQIVISFHYY